MNAITTRFPDGQYGLVWSKDKGAKFDSLNDLMEFAEETNIEVSGPHEFGHRLGAMLVELSEAGYDRREVLEALKDSTDQAWTAASADLRVLLQGFEGL